GLLGSLLAAFGVEQARLQQAHRASAVLVLAAFFLAFHHGAGGQVGDADRRVGLVDVLAAGTRGAKGIHFQVGRVDRNVVDLVQLRQHGHGGGGGVDAPLRLGDRYALHAVGARFEFQLRIGTSTFDAGHDLLVTAMFAGVFAEDLDMPAAAFRVAQVHAEQVAGENRRLVATAAGAHFE